jgi:hypothetical protein
MMRKPVIESAIKTAADPTRSRSFFQQIAETPAGPAVSRSSPEQARILAAVFSGSQVLGAALVAHPHWLAVLEPGNLKFPRREQGVRHEANGLIQPLLESMDYTSALARLREFKQREMLRVGARDLARLGHVSDITREISDLADTCLSWVWEICLRQFTERYGAPWHQDPNGNWKRTSACVLGMGKLGGQELNYSSDVDVLFVYGDEGSVFKEHPGPKNVPRPSMPSHQFFNRLAESFIAEVSRMGAEGALQNAFFAESFLDELAAAAGKDPVALRRRLHASSPRLVGVLDIAAERAGWGTPLPAGRFRGVAAVAGFGSYNAQVAEISLDQGRLRVHRVVCVVDCGRVINPSGVLQQMEGGLVYGLSAALRGEITIDRGRVEQQNFHQYDPLRIHEMPVVEVHIVASEAAPGGIGEVATPAIAPAVTNAIFAATGKRIRRLPISLETLA